MQTIKFEVLKFENGHDRYNFFLETGRNIQRLKNRVLQKWLIKANESGSVIAAWKYWDTYWQWERNGKKTKGSKPKHKINNQLDRSAQKEFYHDLRGLFPTLHTRPLTLTLDKLVATIKKRKSSNFGQLPGWLAVFLGLESLPTFRHPQPIDFDTQNTQIVERDNGDICVLMKLEVPERKAVQDALLLKTRDKKAWRQMKSLRKLLRGELKLKGSSLVYRKGKFFVNFVCDRVEQPPKGLDKDKVAFVRAGKKVPWRVRMNGRSYWRGGNGDHIHAMRTRLSHERRSRQHKYHYAPRKSKGRGRKKATASWSKLDTRWEGYCERYNHEMSRRIVNELIDRGIGTLIYSDIEDASFLVHHGEDEHTKDGWPFFRFLDKLAYKCNDAGIDFYRTVADFRARKRKKKNEDKAKTHS